MNPKKPQTLPRSRILNSQAHAGPKALGGDRPETLILKSAEQVFRSLRFCAYASRKTPYRALSAAFKEPSKESRNHEQPNMGALVITHTILGNVYYTPKPYSNYPGRQYLKP